MNIRSMTISIICILTLAAASLAQAVELEFIFAPGGYETGSISLPKPFAGSMGVVPGNDNLIYAAVGGWQDVDLALIDLSDNSVRIVSDGPFAGLGGIAPLSETQVVLVDNGFGTSGPPDGTILLATDGNGNGSFDDAGEIVELIAPILTGAIGFTGAQTRLVPPGNPSGIPSGSVVVQTADGGGAAELLVITSPLTAPAFRPLGGPYYTGFDYSGGFDFDRQGRIMLGSVDSATFAGSIRALVNLNGNAAIEPGEVNTIVDFESSMADVMVDAENDILFGGFNASFQGAIRTCPVPGDPLNEIAAPRDFASTTSTFISAILLNSKTKPFDRGTGPNGATLLIGGWVGSDSAQNLLTLTPKIPTAASNWERYE